MESAVTSIPRQLQFALLLALAFGAAPVIAQTVVYGSDARAQHGDFAINGAVKAQLAAEPATRVREVNVNTRGAVVTLSGRVESAEEKARAIEIARGTKGVRDVDDQLRVGR